jgi:methionyl-tRNA formyltransferase
MDYRHCRIVFMGTPEIAASLLQTLLESGFNVVAVVAQPDAPVGRAGNIVPVPTKQVALKHGLKVYQPESIRKEYAFIHNFGCDLIVTLAYGQIIPDPVLAWPTIKALNVHGSLLPKLRGAAPIQYALIQDVKKTGITLMEMVSQMDAGSMYAQRELDIEPDDDNGSLRARISRLIDQSIPDLLIDFLNGKLQPITQNENEATFAPSIKKEQEHLNLDLPTRQFIGFVRALSPTPGGYLLDGDLRVKILKTHFHDDLTTHAKGYVSIEGHHLLLQLSDGRLAVEVIQWPGRRPVSGREFVNGHHDVDGQLWK